MLAPFGNLLKDLDEEDDHGDEECRGLGQDDSDKGESGGEGDAESEGEGEDVSSEDDVEAGLEGCGTFESVLEGTITEDAASTHVVF